MNTQQKQALGVGVAALGLVVVYKKIHGGSTTTSQGVTSLTSAGQIAPYTPQSVTTLDPGQSIYDPNSQDFLGPAQNAPAEPPVATTTAPQTTAPSQPGYTVNVQYPATTGSTKNTTKPAQRVSTGRAPARGAIAAPYGPRKPAARKGFTAVGTGSGNWFYVPNKTGAKK